jgi:hypothetical protein
MVTTLSSQQYLQAAGVKGAAGGEDPVALRHGLVVAASSLRGLRTQHRLVTKPLWSYTMCTLAQHVPRLLHMQQHGYVFLAVSMRLCRVHSEMILIRIDPRSLFH